MSFFAEVIISYALITSCDQAGRCEQGSHREAVNAEIIAYFPTMKACMAEAERDTMLLIRGKPLKHYTPGPILGNYGRLSRQPTCYPVTPP